MRSDHAEHYFGVTPRRRRAQTILAALAIGAALLPLAPSGASAADPSFTFLGGGFGHSVGLSQFGAYGMALEGHTWEEIVTHYYTGTVTETVAPSLVAEPLWVNLTQEKTEITLTVRSTGAKGEPATVTFTTSEGQVTASVGDAVTVTHLDNGRCRVSGPDGTAKGTCVVDADWDGFSGDPTVALELGGCSLPNWNAPGGTTYQPCTYARGGLRIRPDNNTATFDVSVEIDIEDYVLGISESPSGWGSTGGMAALEAQAVIARSYAIRRALNRGEPGDRPWCWCQLYDTTVDQNYVGWGHGTQNWIDAVRSTEGQVVVYPGDLVGGIQAPIEAFYSSSTFGATEASEDGFGGYVPYLRSVDDHWSQLPAVGNHSARWERTLTGAQLAARLPGLTSVTGLEITACSQTGAALEITFYGEGGPRAFATRDLRGRLGLLSQQVYNVGSPPPADLPCDDTDDPPAGDQQGAGSTTTTTTGSTTIPTTTTTTTVGAGGPVLFAGIGIDDDTTGDSRGDGDGRPEAGELIEATIAIRNAGGPLSGVSATLSSRDPYVAIAWNTTSPYADLGTGGEGGNTDDWDLAIDPAAPPGHTAVLDLTVTARQAGPWVLQIPVTVSAPGAAPAPGTALAALGDINGNGSSDLAVTSTIEGKPYVLAIDGSTGSRISASLLAPEQYRVVATAVVGDVGGSPAVDVAVLLRAAEPPALVRIVDTATGERLGTKRLGGAQMAWFDIESGDLGAAPSADIVMAGRHADGPVWMIAFDAGTLERIRSAGFGRMAAAVDLEIVDDFAAGAADEVAILGVRPSGDATVVIKDGGSGALIRTVGFGSTPDPIAVEALSGPGRTRTLAVAAAVGSGTRVLVADAATGRLAPGMDLPLTRIVDVAALGKSATGPATDVAVLGFAGDGALLVVVVDPTAGRILSAPQYPAGLDPAALAIMTGTGSGNGLAVLGSDAAHGDAYVTVRDAVTGRAIRSILVS